METEFSLKLVFYPQNLADSSTDPLLNESHFLGYFRSDLNIFISVSFCFYMNIKTQNTGSSWYLALPTKNKSRGCSGQDGKVGCSQRRIHWSLSFCCSCHRVSSYWDGQMNQTAIGFPSPTRGCSCDSLRFLNLTLKRSCGFYFHPHHRKKAVTTK